LTLLPARSDGTIRSICCIPGLPGAGPP
jgi:hypothetical protein